MQRLTDEQRELAGRPEHVNFALLIADRMAMRCPREREEMRAAALEGLCDAASRFDPAKGVKFETFATPRIVGEINDTLRRAMPAGFRRGDLVASRGETAPGLLSMSTTVYLDGYGDPVSLAELIDNGEDPLGWEHDSLDTVRVLSAKLPVLHGAIVREYFSRPDATMKQIAAEAGYSESRVSQIIGASLADLRERLEAVAPVPATQSAEYDQEFLDRFEAKFTRGDGCWLWTASVSEQGSPLIYHKGQKRHARRVSYTIYVGPVPAHREVCQTCNNSRCVNPNHLYVKGDARKEAAV